MLNCGFIKSNITFNLFKLIVNQFFNIWSPNFFKILLIIFDKIIFILVFIRYLSYYLNNSFSLEQENFKVLLYFCSKLFNVKIYGFNPKQRKGLIIKHLKNLKSLIYSFPVINLKNRKIKNE